MSDESKQACQFCGGHIAYDRQYAGRTITCPHCHKEITLGGAETPPVAQVHSPSRKSVSPRKVAVLALALVLVTVLVLGVLGVRFVSKQNAERQRRVAEEFALTKVEADRIKAEAEKAKAEAEIAELKAEQEEKSKAATEAEALAAAEAAKREAEEKVRMEEDRKAKVKKNPVVWGLWEEQDHDAIRIVKTRPIDATVNYKGTSRNTRKMVRQRG
jgi:F0F1-type ATP synthase membrane subunit b/b'